MRMKYPQFDEKDNKGHHVQQDAEECLNALLTTFTEKLKQPAEESTVDKLFGIELKSTYSLSTNFSE